MEILWQLVYMYTKVVSDERNVNAYQTTGIRICYIRWSAKGFALKMSKYINLTPILKRIHVFAFTAYISPEAKYHSRSGRNNVSIIKYLSSFKTH